jgi:ABC-type lipoprotein release transport system permease subunit
MNLQLAWRNIWRNPRRTVVILTAVVIGAWSMIFLAGLMRGIVDGMIQNGISTLTGHIQIHQRDYPADPVVDHRIADSQSLLNLLAGNLPAGSQWSVRARVNAVAGNARHSAGVTLVGIDPDREAKVSFIGTSVTRGAYLQPDDPSGILIGRALADRFQTRLGRKIIITSQDTHGDIASRAFRIAGIFEAEMESTEKHFVFVNLAAAQKMLKMGPAVSEVAVLLPRHGMAQTTAGKLQRILESDKLLVRTWQQTLPLLTAMLELYDNFIFIWFVVVFVAMGFGLVNTTLMAVFERMREIGVLKALGMRPGRIILTIETETFIILIFGLLTGDVLGLLSCWALSFNGIDLSALAQGVEYAGMARIIYPVLQFQDMINANLVVLGLGLLVSLYPAVKAARFRPVEALMHT